MILIFCTEIFFLKKIKLNWNFLHFRGDNKQQFKAVLHLFLCLNPFSSLTQVPMPPRIYYIRCWLVIWVHEADKCSLFKNRKCSLLISQDPKGKCKLKICILFLSIWIATHCACTIRKNKSELNLQWSLNFDHNMLSLSCTRLMRSSVCCPSAFLCTLLILHKSGGVSHQQ